MSKERRERRARRRQRARIGREAATSRNGIKLTDAIERMMEPFDHEEMRLGAHRILVEVCVMAWNLSVLEHHGGTIEPRVQHAIERTLTAADRIGAAAAIEELKKRKTLLFPDDRRVIVESSLQPARRGGRYLTMTSITLDGRTGTGPSGNAAASGPATDSDATTQRGDGVTGPQ